LPSMTALNVPLAALKGTPMIKLKDRKKRTPSSKAWLLRQLNDPYVQAAKTQGFRSRAAFKLIELDDQFHVLTKGARVIDLGAAPGGWTQVALQRVGSSGLVVALDLLEMEEIPGSVTLQADFMTDDGLAAVTDALGGEKADVVLSDMAPRVSGHKGTDHLRIMGLIEAAADFARTVLKPGGSFIAKTLQGGTEHTLLAVLKKDFKTVAHAKPGASRKDSAEMYLVATGFRTPLG
jgi:23S rRNA (uridine2552-2'-O)-methyltransferase